FISYALIANGYESTIAKSAFFSLIVYFFLYILLIPIYGITGAVWSTLIGEFLQMIIFIMFYIRRDKGIST
ncbi:MAG: polysaccharide biosynthesis C-terminal domain-containing protein, partial [Anaerolineales bacterium]|nr:polysaccharide biosynthesis C-terminal domain-containing protein [Anaerolineales bacterium]